LLLSRSKEVYNSEESRNLSRKQKMMEQETSLIGRMKKVEYFSNLSTRDITTILRSGEIMRIPAGQILFHEEAPCFGLCVLLRGEIHMYKLGSEGQENIIAVIKPVIMFNEISAIDTQPNPVTALAYKNSLVWRADCKSFQEGLIRFPKLGLGLLPVLARRNRRLIAKYADLSFRPVRERLAIILLEKSKQGSIQINRKENTIQQLAAHVASNPVVISRILGEFRDLGLIESNRHFISVIQPDALAQLASLNLFQQEPPLVET
jgi:CRP/FNR family transcriptional regulator